MSTQPHPVIALVSRQPTTFDLLLAAIPLVLLAGVVSPHLLPVPPFVGIAAGGGLAGSLVGYGIYVITRRQSTSGDTESPLGGRVGRAD